MKNSAYLPVLIGISHASSENALKLIKELKERGIKPGDSLGIEGYSRHKMSSKADLEREHSRIVEEVRANKKIIQDCGKVLYKGDQIALKQALKKASIASGNLFNLSFWDTMLDYCLKSNVKLVGIDLVTKERKLTPIQKFDMLGETNLRPYFLGPARENIWRKSIAKTKPDFIAFSGGHFKAFIKTVPHRAAVDISLPPLPAEEMLRREIDYFRGYYSRRKYLRRVKKNWNNDPLFARKKPKRK